MSESLQTAFFSFLRGGLVLLATRAHKLSNTPPAQTPRNAAPGTEVSPPEQQPLVGVEDAKKRQRMDSVDSEGSQERESGSRDVWHDSAAALLKILLLTIPVVHFFLYTITFTELFTRFLSLSPSSSLSALFLPYLLPSSSTQQTLTTSPNLHSIVSVLSVLLGTYLRLQCFAALGKLFTFTHTTLADHRLVTWGPYGYARHPSYTGMAMVYGGMVGLLGSQGSWISTIGAWTWSLGCNSHKGAAGTDAERSAYATALVLLVRTAFLLYTLWATCVIGMLTSRAPKEDETLRRKFGREWEEYAEVVRWRFIPYVI